MISYRLGQLIFMDIVSGIFVLIYYLLFLLSANEQEEPIQKVNYLKIYSILFLSITVFSIVVDVVYFFITTESYNLLLVILYYVVILVAIGASVLFIIYSNLNKEKFGVFLFIAAILYTIAYLMVNIETNILNTLYLFGISVSQTQLSFMILSLISGLAGIVSIILLLIHGFKNSDTFLIAAGFLYIGYYVYSLLATIFVNFLPYP